MSDWDKDRVRADEPGLAAVEDLITASVEEAREQSGETNHRAPMWRPLVDWPTFAAARFDATRPIKRGDAGTSASPARRPRQPVPEPWRQDITRQLDGLCVVPRVVVVRCPDDVSQRLAASVMIERLAKQGTVCSNLPSAVAFEATDGASVDAVGSGTPRASYTRLRTEILLAYWWLPADDDADDDLQSSFLLDVLPDDSSSDDEAPFTDDDLAQIPLDEQWNTFKAKEYHRQMTDAEPTFSVLTVEARPGSQDAERPIWPLLDKHVEVLNDSAASASLDRGPHLLLFVRDDDRRLARVGPLATCLTIALRPHPRRWLGEVALKLADAVLRLAALTGHAVISARAETPFDIESNHCVSCATAWVRSRLRDLPAVQANLFPTDSGGSSGARAWSTWPGRCALDCPLADVSPRASEQDDPSIDEITLADSFLDLTERLFAPSSESTPSSFLDVFVKQSKATSATPGSLRPYRALLNQQLLADALRALEPQASDHTRRLDALLQITGTAEGSDEDSDEDGAALWEHSLHAWPTIRGYEPWVQTPAPFTLPTSFKTNPGIAGLDVNAVRLAECARLWFSELSEDEDGRAALRDIGLTVEEPPGSTPKISLADALRWMRAKSGAGHERWQRLPAMAQDLAPLFGLPRWRGELRDKLKIVNEEPQRQGRPEAVNVRHARRLLSGVLTVNPLPPSGPRGAARQLWDAIHAMNGDGAGLLRALRKLEALMKYLIVATGLLIPAASWKRHPWGEAANDESERASVLPTSAWTAQRGLLSNIEGLTMRPLGDLLRGMQKRVRQEIETCYGSTEPWKAFEDLIEKRNLAVHHGSDSGESSRRTGPDAAESTVDDRDRPIMEGLRKLAGDPAPWQALPLLVEVIEEHVGPLGSRITFRTELGDTVTAPLQFVDGRRWRRGELLSTSLLIVARGPLADWSLPVAVGYRPDLLGGFCDATRDTTVAAR